MILFTNLGDVKINGKNFKPKPVLKLTVENHFEVGKLTPNQRNILKLLYKESKVNKFKIILQ